MKGFLLAGFLTAAAFSFSASASFALEPGCDPGIMEKQKNHSNAIRARDKAYTQEIIKRNDSTLALTCFDQQIAVTSDLGGIFSDVIPEEAPPANTEVFTPVLAYEDRAEGEELGKDLVTVVAPVLGQELNNFPDALSELMDGMISDLASLIPLFSVDNDGNDISDEMDTVLAGGDGYADEDGADGDGAGMNCDRMANLWDDNTPDSGVESIQGNGIEEGAGYYTLEEFLGGPGSMSDEGGDFSEELSNATSRQALDAALADLTAMDHPGGIPTYPASPNLPDDATTAQIIEGM